MTWTSYLQVARETFVSIAQKFEVAWFKTLTIVASNDINEDTILSLNDQARTLSTRPFLGDSFSTGKIFLFTLLSVPTWFALSYLQYLPIFLLTQPTSLLNRMRPHHAVPKRAAVCLSFSTSSASLPFPMPTHPKMSSLLLLPWDFWNQPGPLHRQLRHRHPPGHLPAPARPRLRLQARRDQRAAQD